MTQDEIIRMAREAGFHIENWSFGERVSVYESGKTIDITNELKDFVALVAAREREVCAKVCEPVEGSAYEVGVYKTMQTLAAAIRARGETK